MERRRRDTLPRMPKTAVRTALIAAATLAAAAAVAVEVEPNVVYPGGTRLEAPELGVAFTVPAGWRGSWPAGTEVFVLQPEADPSVHVLAMGEEGTRAELAALMGAPIDLGGGLSLHPEGSVTERGPALAGRYEVRGGATPLAAYGEALASPHGIAVAYLLIAPPGAIAAHENAVRALVDGTTLGAAADRTAEATPSGDAAGDRWDVYLKGKYLVRYYTATGFTDEQHLWLCSDGSFRRRGASGGFGGGASGAFEAGSTGRWSATGAGESGRLTLQYGDGSVARHDLRWDYGENKLYLDGKRWLHGTNDVCR